MHQTPHHIHTTPCMMCHMSYGKRRTSFISCIVSCPALPCLALPCPVWHGMAWHCILCPVACRVASRGVIPYVMSRIPCYVMSRIPCYAMSCLIAQHSVAYHVIPLSQDNQMLSSREEGAWEEAFRATSQGVGEQLLLLDCGAMDLVKIVFLNRERYHRGQGISGPVNCREFDLDETIQVRSTA